jgi:hypothetical protein
LFDHGRELWPEVVRDMGVYLEDHPPARRQFHDPRRAPVTGAIVIHTAENAADIVLPDSGAEGVANFIARRGDPGSYHSVVDSDSIVRVGHYHWEMFHEGTGGNRWSLGLAFACRSAQWPMLPERWYVGALRNAAIEAANMALWVESSIEVIVPAKRITASEYRSGRPGFVGHAELDPGRRSDPGLEFPWEEFLAYYAAETATVGGPPIGPDEEEEDLSRTFNQAMADLDELWYAYRGQAPNASDRRSWGRDLAEKIFNRGEDPRPTLAYVEWVLREQHLGLRDD